mmetsp:Transcript_77204/g.89842  ORF Transcript_77204/g.89842 Transcript_77204/m.89842 type:complete len:256 (-) Transcript_77204:1701-2468(-)
MITTPHFSSARRASCVRNRFAPSTITRCFSAVPASFSNLPASICSPVAPSTSTSCCTFSSVTDAGRPPHGTNTSARVYGVRWNVLRNAVPSETSVPSGSVTSLSVVFTKKPFGDSLRTSKLSSVRRAFASRSSSCLSTPFGSCRLAFASTSAMYFSRLRRISFDPRSPSGPPVWNFVRDASSIPSLRYTPSTHARTLRVVMPYVSCGMPPMLGSLPVVNDFHAAYPRALAYSAPADGKLPAVFSSGPRKMISGLP